MVNYTGLKVIKLEYILRLKIKSNGWRVRKQPIIALYYESENELKFYNLEARGLFKNMGNDPYKQCCLLSDPVHAYQMIEFLTAGIITKNNWIDGQLGIGSRKKVNKLFTFFHFRLK